MTKPDDFRDDVTKLSGFLYHHLPDAYQGTKPKAVDTAINFINDLLASLSLAQATYCHTTCWGQSHTEICKKMTELNMKGGENAQHGQEAPRAWFKGQEHLEQSPQKVHEGGEGGDELLDKDTKAALISRLENWKFASASAVFMDIPLIKRESLREIGDAIETLAEMFNNSGSFDGHMGSLVFVTVSMLVDKVRAC